MIGTIECDLETAIDELSARIDAEEEVARLALEEEAEEARALPLDQEPEIDELFRPDPIEEPAAASTGEEAPAEEEVLDTPPLEAKIEEGESHRGESEEDTAPLYPEGTIALPVAILFHPKLTLSDKMIYAALQARSTPGGALWATLEEIADDLQVHLSTVRRAVKKLVEEHIIVLRRDVRQGIRGIEFQGFIGGSSGVHQEFTRGSSGVHQGFTGAPLEPDRNKALEATTKAKANTKTSLSPSFDPSSQVLGESTSARTEKDGEREKAVASLQTKKPLASPQASAYLSPSSQSRSTLPPPSHAEQPFEAPRAHVVQVQDDGTEWTPDPTFSAHKLMALWQSLGLSMGRQSQILQENKLAMLHRNAPHWTMAEVEQAMRKIKGEKLDWATKYGPGYLADTDRNGRQQIEKILAWSPLAAPAAAKSADPIHPNRPPHPNRPLTKWEQNEYNTQVWMADWVAQKAKEEAAAKNGPRPALKGVGRV